MNKILREPLLHFILLGALLFVAYSWLSGVSNTRSAIVVSQDRTAAISEAFARTWMRPPTAQELQGLVEDYLKDEIYSREALALGLEREDSIIRRRLRQKMEFMSEDGAALDDATDAQLQAYLVEHAVAFTPPTRVSFQQVYVNPQRRGANIERDAKAMLLSLQAGADPARLTDSSMLPSTLEAATPQEIANAFGEEFVGQLATCAVGQWCGPQPSPFGLHVVRVTERKAGALPTLDATRPAVLREWQAQQQKQRAEAFYAALRAKYEVSYEGESTAMVKSPQMSTKSGQD